MHGERVAQPFRRTDVKHLVVCVSVLCVCVRHLAGSEKSRTSYFLSDRRNALQLSLCACACSVVFSTCQCISKGRLD